MKRLLKRGLESELLLNTQTINILCPLGMLMALKNIINYPSHSYRYKIGNEIDVASVVKEGEDFTDPAKRRAMKGEVKKLFTEKYEKIR